MISNKMLYNLILLLIILSVLGCTGTSPNALYYTLSSIEKDSIANQSTIIHSDFAIGIGPVTFPDQLERPAIVVQTGKNQLNINEFHRWAGSLQQNFTRVMTQNLAILLKTDQIMARPWERYFKPDIRIAVDIQKFGGQLGVYAELDTIWVIIEEGKDVEAVVHRSEIKETVSGDSYEALVAAQSRALAILCKEITKALVAGQ
jgi:uncharacterized lipoprotein YmbA